MEYLDDEIQKKYTEFKNCNSGCDEIKQQLINLIDKHRYNVIRRSGPPHYEIYQNVYFLNRSDVLIWHTNEDYMERRRF